MSTALGHALILYLFPALIAFAAASDLVSMTISNRLQLILLAGFAAVALLLGFDVSQWLEHLGAFALVLVIGFICFSCGWIGGGDAKLVACIGWWYGFDRALAEFAMIAALFGGVLTFALVYARSCCLPNFLSQQSWAVRLHDQREGIPYGIALAFAALVTYPGTALFKLAL